MLQNYHPHNLKNEMRNTYMLRVVQTKVSGIIKFGKSGFMLTEKVTAGSLSGTLYRNLLVLSYIVLLSL